MKDELRPSELRTYVGQSDIKESLSVLIKSAKKRNVIPDHVLLYGESGYGKTTLALIVGEMLGQGTVITSGPSLRRVGDIAGILTNMKNGGVLFIDEIHRLLKPVEEVLYSALEDGCVDIVLGKGTAAQAVRLELKPFMIIGATTQFSKLSPPLRSRFSGGVYRLKKYSEVEMISLLQNSCKKIKFELEDEWLKKIAKRSRGVPRHANSILKRIRDYVEVYTKNNDSLTKALELLNIDEFGLSDFDYKILKILKNNKGKPVGLKTLSTILGEDEETIELINEPFLLQNQFIAKTNSGRVITEDGVAVLRKIQ